MSDLGLACGLRMVTEQTWLPLAQPDTLHEALAALRGGVCLARQMEQALGGQRLARTLQLRM